MMLLGFGAVLPDRVDGAGASVLTRAADPVHLGLSAGFANTLGILSFVLATAAVVLAAVLVHVILDAATHAGHLDAARELIDGRQHLVL